MDLLALSSARLKDVINSGPEDVVESALMELLFARFRFPEMRAIAGEANSRGHAKEWSRIESIPGGAPRQSPTLPSISIAVSDATGKMLMECIIETKAATLAVAPDALLLPSRDAQGSGLPRPAVRAPDAVPPESYRYPCSLRIGASPSPVCQRLSFTSSYARRFPQRGHTKLSGQRQAQDSLRRCG